VRNGFNYGPADSVGRKAVKNSVRETLDRTVYTCHKNKYVFIHVYVYICTHVCVCMYLYTYAGICEYMYVCTQGMYMCIPQCVYVRVHTGNLPTRTRVCTHMYVHITSVSFCLYKCIYSCTCADIPLLIYHTCHSKI